jgi:hypothetical protein
MSKHDKPVVDFMGRAVFVHRTATDPLTIAEYGDQLDEDNGYEFAKVYAMNHPILGMTDVRTSIVIKKNPDGSFETLNTIYKPVKEEENE